MSEDKVFQLSRDYQKKIDRLQEQQKENERNIKELEEEKTLFHNVNSNSTQELDEICSYWKGHKTFAGHLERSKADLEFLSKKVYNQISEKSEEYAKERSRLIQLQTDCEAEYLNQKEQSEPKTSS